MLRYVEYFPEGLPIATGVIEGTCRHLVNDRVDITGARWGLRRAEAILKLRSSHRGKVRTIGISIKNKLCSETHLSQYDNYSLQMAA